MNGRRLRATVSRTLGAWETTAAHQRAIALVGLGAVLAALGRRPDLLVIVAPIAVAAVWGQLARPRATVEATARLSDVTLREGQAVALHVVTEPVVPDAHGVVTLARVPFVDRQSGSGIALLDDGTATLGVRSTRWGRRRVGTVSVTLTSAWGAYRVGPEELPDLDTATLPVPAAFDASAPTPHPRGIVGLNRSNRPGSGSEFNTIRPFHPGDRLRRISWPVSLRTGTLHVTSTFTDEDAHVILLVDAFSDLGPREGIDGRPTSLDVTVRAAGAMSEHFLRSNDRLTLRTVGAAEVPALGTGSGTNHLRRVLDTLALITPASERRDTGEHALRGVDPNALCLVLSPLIDQTMVSLAHTLAARGMTVVVVDTFPDHLVAGTGDVYQSLAWRMRLLSREAQVSSLRLRGVPVVPWRGPGSLDQVLRDIARRSSAPRLSRR
ncbi:DUF58 domain-containing protein [Humibacillus xanthopallidus]|uniref:Uncharacterized protein (DUF58 family) n=1 Tax=Humibacillus xanthopallidus TaxID=412689 RepID=A0A543HJR3_9MICO|nr:DUF58 domain-containing protein [Humibacillus xanthopallidus]TQM58564.1 uncharacterized protein (DUF58 family) [Humibacillus xanthopallidus]